MKQAVAALHVTVVREIENDGVIELPCLFKDRKDTPDVIIEVFYLGVIAAKPLFEFLEIRMRMNGFSFK